MEQQWVNFVSVLNKNLTLKLISESLLTISQTLQAFLMRTFTQGIKKVFQSPLFVFCDWAAIETLTPLADLLVVFQEGKYFSLYVVRLLFLVDLLLHKLNSYVLLAF